MLHKHKIITLLIKKSINTVKGAPCVRFKYAPVRDSYLVRSRLVFRQSIHL